jgi:hypothetical protein
VLCNCTKSVINNQSINQICKRDGGIGFAFKSHIWMNSQQEGICLRRRKNVKASKMGDFFASEMASKKQ